MKVGFDETNTMKIIAENGLEAFALKCWWNNYSTYFVCSSDTMKNASILSIDYESYKNIKDNVKGN